MAANQDAIEYVLLNAGVDSTTGSSSAAAEPVLLNAGVDPAGLVSDAAEPVLVNTLENTGLDTNGLGPTVVHVDTGTAVTTANPTVDLTSTPVAGDVLILTSFEGNTPGTQPSAISGLGATWTQVPGAAFNYVNSVWKGVGATGTGTITATVAGTAGGRLLRVHHLRGVSTDVLWRNSSNFGRATSNQIVIGIGTSQSSVGTSLTTWQPSKVAGWIDQLEMSVGTRFVNTTYIIPRDVGDYNVAGSIGSGMIVVGCPVAGATITRRNPIGNSSLETTQSGANFYSATNASIGISAAGDPVMFGTRCVKMTANAAAPIAYANYSGGTGGPFVAPGDTGTFSVYVYSVNARNGRPVIRWKTFSGLAISSTTGATVALAAGTWTRLILTGTAPATAMVGECAVEITDGVSTDVTYLDGWLWDTGSSAGTYFDGYTVTAGRLNLFEAPVLPIGVSSPDQYTSIQTTVPPTPTPSVVAVNTGSITTAANPTVTLTNTPLPGDVLILVDTRGQSSDSASTVMSGCGATWKRVGGGREYMEYWVGTGATSSGTITGTASATANGRALRVHHLRGVTKDVYVERYLANYPVTATPNQIVIAGTYSQSSTQTPILTELPANMWADDAEITFASSRRFNSTKIIPQFPWTFNVVGQPYSFMIVVGSPLPGTKIARRNLVGNSSFETNVSTDWTGAGWTTAVKSPIAAVSSASISGIWQTGTTSAVIRKGTGANGPQGQAFEGRTYTVSGYARCNNTRTVGASIMWLDSGQFILSTGTYTTPVTLPANTWVRVSWTGVAPVNTRFVAPECTINGTASGDVFWWDGFMIEEGSTVGEYFDGYTIPPAGDDTRYYFVGPQDLFQSVQVVPTSTKVWSYESGAWVDRSGAVMRAWNGTTWVAKRPKRWDGSTWLPM